MNAAPEISIVIPAYREGPELARNLEKVVEAARPVCASLELVVIDDGSPDDTWSGLTALADEIPELRAFRLTRNFGKEAALVAGIMQSRGAAVIVMDADLQHPPELIGEMTRLWRDQGFDIVNAVKRLRGQETRSKSVLTRLYHRLFSGLAGIDVEQASDFKLLDRAVAEQFCGLPERGTFFRGLVAWMGYRQTSVEFDVQPRASGDSRWSFWKLVRLAIDSIIAFSTVPMHLITMLGVVLAAVSTVLGARTLWLWAAGKAEPGFTTVILLQIGFTAILLIGLGVIGAYIAKIYDEVKHRPRFIIQDQAIGATADEAGRETGKYRTDR